jgi:hypothetical protein
LSQTASVSVAGAPFQLPGLSRPLKKLFMQQFNLFTLCVSTILAAAASCRDAQNGEQAMAATAKDPGRNEETKPADSGSAPLNGLEKTQTCES